MRGPGGASPPVNVAVRATWTIKRMGYMLWIVQVSGFANTAQRASWYPV